MTFTVIRGGRLLDIDSCSAPYRDLLVGDGIIREVGSPGIAAPESATVIDASNTLMHPGLINGHTHSHGNLAKGVGERWTLELLLTAAPWITGKRQIEEMHLSTLIGACEMVLKGCTACYDLVAELPTPSIEGIQAVTKAYGDIGMRAVVAPMVADANLFEAIPGLMEALPPGLQQDVEKLKLAPYKVTLERLSAIIDAWTMDREAIRPAIAPTIPLHCSDAFMIACRDLARGHGLGLHSHIAESRVQAVSAVKRYGKTMCAHIEDLGLLGPNFVVAHGVWLDDDDMRRLAEYGASVSHNAGSNALLGNGIAYARRMLEMGVNLAIGTDGASCCDHQNMFEAMRMASYVSHVRGPEWYDWLTPGEILRAATEGSARALGFDRLGRLEPGYHADIVFHDLNAINWIPINNPVNQLVHTEDGSSVEAVMIAGRMVVKQRKLVEIDLARLASKAEAARQRLDAVNAPTKKLCDQLERFVGSYCPGLAREPYHIQRFGAAPH
ncbi:MAG: amidohydrolase family protein [Hyphomicrobiaceae bacterium]